MPWFNAQPVDESFFATAPFQLKADFDIPRPAADVWADLTADDTLNWCRILNSVTWTSPRPFGVGTTRIVKALGGTNVIHEKYFVWEEGRRKAFYVEKASAPLFKRMAEDYVVEPTGETECRFTWIIAAELSAIGKAGAPANRALLKSLFKDTRKHYAAR